MSDHVQSASTPLPDGASPVGAAAMELVTTASTSRRDFLAQMGFSLTAATLAACSRAPVEQAIPLLNQPEELTPGVPNWYATTCGGCTAACALVVKTRDGRPIKIEGNERSSLFGGGTCAVGQASVLSLYDEQRLRGPLWRGIPASWTEVDGRIHTQLAAAIAEHRSIALLTGTLVGPATRSIAARWCERYSGCRHVIYDAVSHAAMREANRQSFGVAAIPHYRFDLASLIVGFGADFLGTWLSPVEFARQYAAVRRPEAAGGAVGDGSMCHHVQFEAGLSLTGANADLRVPVDPSGEGVVAVELLCRLERLAGTASDFEAPRSSVDPWLLDRLAEQLWRRRRRSLIVSATNDVPTQLVMNAINALLGNFSHTIDLERPSLQRQGDDDAMAGLVEEMNRGHVGALVIYGVNPVYDYPGAERFIAGLEKVGLVVSLADRPDETAAHAHAVCPDHHYLEAWSDAEPVAGRYSLAQPTIRPLFDTRAAQESLLKWMGATPDFLLYLREFWRTRIHPRQTPVSPFDAFWNQALHDGVVEIESPGGGWTDLSTGSPAGEVNPTSPAVWRPAARAIGERHRAAQASTSAGHYEVVLHETVALRDGRHANNPWLQELPDPITSLTWANCAAIAPALAARLGLEPGDVVAIASDRARVEVPVYIQPGQSPQSVALALGYGRTRAGKVGGDIGANAFPLVRLVEGRREYHLAGVTIAKTGRREPLALTQLHQTLEGRPIVQETTHAALRAQPAIDGDRPPRRLSLWNEPGSGDHRWGLSVDLTTCTGCSACVVACQAENNVPVVGKEEVHRAREMHWIRIDRYHAGPGDSPRTVFQPMMCQHCNHAPCETVCPVLATVHSSEGINQQIYNRCIGTRYCANNCPYKVRRFNWFQYANNAKFDYTLNSPLEAMVLNPDVVVRSRGVMEKCSLCIQRIQAGKLSARLEQRGLRDDDIRTACQQACPTQAIVFGDLNDPASRAARLAHSPRSYHVLDELGTRPNVSYLAKVRNPLDPGEPS
jgi:Fe-S-cluster-containing dehydrogenase component/anaerobic selenocysteine-containing dehydrogenase